MDTYSAEVNPWILRSELLDCIFLVLETVVAEVAVAVVVIPLRPVRMAAPIADCYDDEAKLGKTVCSGESPAPADVVGLDLRARVNVITYRIDLCGVEVEWLVDCSVKVGNAVGSLHRETLREFVSGSEEE